MRGIYLTVEGSKEGDTRDASERGLSVRSRLPEVDPQQLCSWSLALPWLGCSKPVRDKTVGIRMSTAGSPSRLQTRAEWFTGSSGGRRAASSYGEKLSRLVQGADEAARCRYAA